MVKRLLNALDYPHADSIDVKVETNFRKVVGWLEQNRIKKASPNISNTLNNINSADWLNAFIKYKDVLKCPKFENNVEDLNWLLGYAVELHYSPNKGTYNKHAVENLTSKNVPNVIAENPLDKLDFRSKEFIDGINKLANIVKVTPHPDPFVTLKAVADLISTRLTSQALENPKDYIVTGVPFSLSNADLGFNLSDPVLNQAAKILRILYIHDLRDLQTKANELIVAVQNVTAYPKTDTKLGKVGR